MVGDLQSIHRLVQSNFVQTLLGTHPNDVSEDWSSELWWDWAAEEPERWRLLVQYYASGTVVANSSIPAKLITLIREIRSLELARDVILLQIPKSRSRPGESPKKTHEVDQLRAYITKILSEDSLSGVRNIVDVGSGQGYLSRVLNSLPVGLNPTPILTPISVLALDANEYQTQGASRLDNLKNCITQNNSEFGPISHETAFITSSTLNQAVENWTHGNEGTTPVMSVALHACGCLTLDVIRAFLAQYANESPRWTPAASIVVGCCYNLMDGRDFPLSKSLLSMCTSSEPLLSTGAFHLATYMPRIWFRTPQSTAAAALSVRKVVWRAIIQDIIKKSGITSTTTSTAGKVNVLDRDSLRARIPRTARRRSGANIDDQMTASCLNSMTTGAATSPEIQRLGKLNDHVYSNWDTFIQKAGQKMGVDFVHLASSQDSVISIEERRLRRIRYERRLEVVNVSRCLLGPLVESLIILDRVQWIREQLESIDRPQKMQVELVNVFDQSISGRNVAIVIRPV